MIGLPRGTSHAEHPGRPRRGDSPVSAIPLRAKRDRAAHDSKRGIGYPLTRSFGARFRAAHDSKRFSVVLATLGLLVCSDQLRAEPTLTVEEGWHTVFGGERAVFHALIGSDDAGAVRFGWALRVGQRTAQRRERQVELTGAEPARIAFDVDVPPVREGVVFPADLELLLRTDEATAPAATLTRRLWVFPKDPFADRTEWLSEQRLRVLDPAETTERILGQAGVSFEVVARPAQVEAEPEPVTLIVGSGISLLDYPTLGESLVRLAARGHRVLCLCPTEGELELPGVTVNDLPSPAQLVFRRNDVIRDLDKRLDAEAWATDGMLQTTGVRVETIGAKIVWTVKQDASGWPWVAASFGQDGRFVLCGFPIIEHWDSGPTPRFLFLRILEWLTMD